MSIGWTYYPCMCGGTIEERWDSEGTQYICDKCDNPVADKEAHYRFKRAEEYPCICGGLILDGWDGDEHNISCDKCYNATAITDDLFEYAIPGIWKVTGTMYITATSLEEAKKKAMGDYPLPTETEYLDDSYEVDVDGHEYGNYRDIRTGLSFDATGKLIK